MADRVLVTGADGFVGRHLTDALRARGTAVVPLSRADVDLAQGVPPLPDVSHVYHLAGRPSVAQSWQDPRSSYETNVLGTVAVLDWCRRTGTHMTFVSSYVYGRPERLPIDEAHPLQAFNPYGHSKILAEEACRFFVAEFGVRLTIVRPFNIYGPGQGAEFLVPTLVRQALDPAVTAISVADLRPRRDFLHVDDLVALLLAAAAGPAGRVYNAGSGRSVSIDELVGIINAQLPVPKRLESREEHRPSEVLDVVADVSRARRELGWEPQVTLHQGIARLLSGARPEAGATP